MTSSDSSKAKKLFVVSITNEIVVLAESEAEALKLARFEREIEWDQSDFSAAPMRHFPSDWDVDCIPFGDRLEEDPDRTIGQWMAEGAAPEYVVRLKK